MGARVVSRDESGAAGGAGAGSAPSARSSSPVNVLAVVVVVAFPKTIDFTPTDGAGSGKQFLGIYMLGEKTRKLCFAPKERGRPADFSSSAGSEIVLVTFKRERSE